MDKSFLNKILIKAEELKSSSTHISSNHIPYVRIHGSMKIIENFQVLKAKDVLNIMISIIDKTAEKDFVKKARADFIYFNAENKIKYRVNMFKDYNGINAVFKALNTNIIKLEDEQYPEVFRKIASLEKGLVLVCGPAGSGKSATLSSMIDYINRTMEKHIITIEDPIEYIYKSNKSLINQRQVGRDVQNFSDGIKDALKEDPDIILLSGIHDKETIKMALTAAETGHLVFSTLYTMSATKTIDRIIDLVDPENKELVRSMLSTSLKAVILQTLLKKPEGDERIPAFEVLIVNSAIRNLIRENKVFQIDSIIQTGAKFGMITMKNYVEKLVKNNLVEPNYAIQKILGSDDDAFRIDNQSKYYEVE